MKKTAKTITVDGYCHNYYDGTVRHRSTGPAVTLANGYQAWYIHGRRLSDDEIIMLHFFNQEEL